MFAIRKSDYAKLFTMRKDGVYQKYINGRYLYSKDPEELYRKWQAVIHNEPEEISFRQAAEDWEAEVRENITDRTWLNYKPHYEDLKKLYGKLKLIDIEPQDIKNDLLRLKSQKYSSTIIRTRRTIFNQIFSLAVVNGHLKYNPVSEIKTPRGTSTKRKAPTDTDLRAIFDHLDAPFGFFPYFLLCTGVRKSEALALTVKDIDIPNRLIHIDKSLDYLDNANPTVKPPKTENGIRDVPIVDVLLDPLKDHIKTLSGEILFPNPKSNRNPGGGYMTEKAYEVAWKRYCEEAGLNITAHQIRHGAATVMFESGVDVYTAQKILGHAQITTTMSIYTELREKQQKKSITNLNRGLSKYIKEKK